MADGGANLKPSKLARAIRGAKGGSSSSRTPVEAPDTLNSNAHAHILDLLGEGELAGFYSDNALKDIFLDETPVMNEDGTLNFTDVYVDWRLGTLTQQYMKGFPSVANEIAVGTELKAATPWIKAISNLELSAVRVRLSVAALSKTDSTTGDINGYSVSYAIDLATDGGAFITVHTNAMTGKTNTKYERSHRIDLPDAAVGWTIRVRRLTADDESAAIQDTTFVESYTEIMDIKMRYPNSAYVGLKMNSAQFRSIPTRGFRMLGRLMRVPSNYNPVTGVYTGLWDGTFQLAWTRNPAWIFYDLVTNERFGLGQFVDDTQIDKWSLYKIGQYCDELVPDGKGGTEPRFTATVYLQRQEEAYKVLQDLASIFRGISYWGSGTVVPVSDMPRDPVYTYTNANVKDGKFSYQGSSRRARHTVALVSWSDPDDFNRQKVEYVEDEEAIARYGVQTTQITAVGCTSQGQAQRVGRWLLLTERYETNTVTFVVGLDQMLALPGNVIRVADAKRAGRRIGGRIKQMSPGRLTVTVDALPTPIPVAGDELVCILPNGAAEKRTISVVNEAGKYMTVSAAFSALAIPESVWAVESSTLQTQLYTVISVGEGEGLSAVITALQHEPGKFDAVDFGTKIEPRVTTAIESPVQRPPTNVRISAKPRAGFVLASTVVTAHWNKAPGAVSYEVEWRRNDGEWSAPQKVLGNETELYNAFAGKYVCKVSARNAIGITSIPAVSKTFVVEDQALKPGFVEGLETSIADALTTAQNAEATADGAVVSFWTPTMPVIGTGAGKAKEGDIWFDTDDGNRIWRVVAGVWVDAQDDDLALALAAAADAQSTADGKVKTYFSSTAPVPPLALGDLWFNTNTKKLFRWSGTAWDQNIADVTLDQIAGSGVNILWDEYSQPNSQTDDLVFTDANSTKSYDAAQSVGTANGSLKLGVTGNTLGASYVVFGTSVTDYNMPLLPGKKYIVSASIRSNNGTALFRPKIKNSNGVLYDTSGVNQGPGTANVWARLSWVVDTSANLYDNGVLILYTNQSGTDTDYTVWIDRVMAEEMKGNLEFPSSWQPGPAGRQALMAIANAASAQATADGKINSFFQDAPPAIGSGAGQAQDGDIWFDTNDGNKIYTVVGSAWVATPDSRIAQAIADAAGAQATADGKVKTFYQDATPTATGIGDLWYSSLTLLLKRWDGSSWTGTDFASADGENLLPNSSFVSNNTGCPLTVEHTTLDALCDGWVVDAAGNGITNTGVSYTGKAIRLRTYATDPIAAGDTVEVRAATSKPISVQEGKTYEFGFTTNGNTFNGSVSVPGTIDVRQRINVRWYDEDGVSISYVQAAMIQQRSSGTASGKVVAPTGARTCKVIIAMYARNTTGSAWSISDGGGSVLANAYFRRVWMRKIDELRVAGSNERIGDQRNLPGSLTSAYGVTNTTAALSATSAGAISVIAHTKRYGGASVAYSAVSNAITGKAVGSSWVVYCIDPDYSGGVQTWLAAANVNTVMNLGDGVVVAGTITIPSSGSSGGGGGGGGNPDDYCVDWDTVLPDGRLVRDLKIGDMVPCIDVTSHWPVIEMHPLQQISFGCEDCYAIITEDGVICEQSKSTPMDLPDGRQVKTPEMLGERVLTYQDGELLWNTVVKLPFIGLRKVVKVNVGNRMFLAGICREATLATHNIKWSP